MTKMLINATHSDEIRVAIVDGVRLIDLDIERPELQQNRASIYKGKISSIEPSLGAVFVDYDEGRHGFLPFKEISREYFLQEPASDQPIDIRSVLKIGQELVVQVEKEERGTKGAALTTFISLAGSYLVLMPNNPKAGGISRRIDGEEREELRETFTELQVPEGMGLIIRTAGVGRSAEELNWDLQILLRYWEAIKQAAVARPGPYLIHQESDVIIRAIRDYLRQDVQEVIIDEVEAYNRAKNYIQQVRPDFLERLKLYNDPLPLFSRFHTEQQIESAYQREVQLPSGGSIVIDHTEALVAIDINSARATKGSSIEETAYNTNLEAAEEIARQLRLRDIGGLIVIDFIDMIPTHHQRDVENCLRNALKQDRARIQVGRISRFGLLEMSRQRLRTSLRKSTRIACPRCEGQGAIRTVESIATSIIHLLQEQSLKGSHVQLHVQLPIDVATYIINEKRDTINKIEQDTQSEIIIVPNEHLLSPQYYLKQSRFDPTKQLASYKLVKTPRVEAISTQRVMSNKLPEPAIAQFLSNTITETPTPIPRKKPSSQGMIKRLWEAMFGNEKEAASQPISQPLPSETSSTIQQEKEQTTTPRKKTHTSRMRTHRRPSRNFPAKNKVSPPSSNEPSQSPTSWAPLSATSMPSSPRASAPTTNQSNSRAESVLAAENRKYYKSETSTEKNSLHAPANELTTLSSSEPISTASAKLSLFETPTNQIHTEKYEEQKMASRDKQHSEPKLKQITTKVHSNDNHNTLDEKSEKDLPK